MISHRAIGSTAPVRLTAVATFVPVNVPALRKIPTAPAMRSILLEGEDALLNGMTRSLERRLSGLNVPVD